MVDVSGQERQALSWKARQLGCWRRVFETLDAQKRDAILLLGVRAGGAAFAFLTQVAIARWAGAGTFGLYAIAWTWIMILGTLSQAGFGVAMTRFVARYVERQRPERAWQAIIFSVQFVATLGILTSLVSAILILFFADTPHVTMATFVMLLAVAIVPLYGLSELGQGVLRGMGENMRAFVPGFLLRPGLLFLFISLAFLAHTDVTAAFLIGATGFSLLFIVLLQWQWIWRYGKKLQRASRHRRHLVHWLVVALPMVMTDAYLLLVSYMDLIVLDLFVSEENVAVYFAAVKIIALVWFIPFAISGVSARVLAQSFERGDHGKIQSDVYRFIAWGFWPTLASSAVLFFFGGYILQIFGSEFSVGLSVLQILSVGLVVQAAAGPIRYLMTMTSEQNSSAIILIISAFGNIALNFSLIPLWGLEGAAIATVMTQILATGLMVFQTHRKLGIWSFVSLRI